MTRNITQEQLEKVLASKLSQTDGVVNSIDEMATKANRLKEQIKSGKGARVKREKILTSLKRDAENRREWQPPTTSVESATVVVSFGAESKE